MIDKTFKIISLAVTTTVLLASTLAQGQPHQKAAPKAHPGAGDGTAGDKQPERGELALLATSPPAAHLSHCSEESHPSRYGVS